VKLLIDNNPRVVAAKSAAYSFVGGQLLTPLTRNRNHGGVFAIDNGAFSGFRRDGFLSLLQRNEGHRERCLFVCCPDVVGSARRTLEAFEHWSARLRAWPVALVAQDGLENLPIPWTSLAAVFIGGSTEWKESKSAADVIRAAQIMGVHTHVGRINTPARWRLFSALGVDTCDGSGVSRYDHMLDAIAECEQHGKHLPLFAESGSSGDSTDETGSGEESLDAAGVAAWRAGERDTDVERELDEDCASANGAA
jgi:hypothetical protein